MCGSHLVEVPILSVLLLQSHIFLALSTVARSLARISTSTGYVLITTSKNHCCGRARHHAVLVPKLDTLPRDAPLNDDTKKGEPRPEGQENVRAQTEGDASVRASQQPVPVVAVAEVIKKPVDNLEVLHKVVGTE